MLTITPTIPDTPPVKGWDFNKGRDLDGILESFYTTGFQATSFGQAVNEVNRMVGRMGALGRSTPALHASIRMLDVLGTL